MLVCPCKAGDLINLSGSWGVEKYLVYTINLNPPKDSQHRWVVELIPINDDDFYSYTRRIKVTDIDLMMYDLEIVVIRTFGATNANNDQEIRETERPSAVNCTELCGR